MLTRDHIVAKHFTSIPFLNAQTLADLREAEECMHRAEEDVRVQQHSLEKAVERAQEAETRAQKLQIVAKRQEENVKRGYALSSTLLEAYELVQ